ncbi:hypothetical protein JG687_00010335 [Phytophthora cactorum]|uniref:Uncharacterized protein n=1 Tax=Phytophthora cactorum TaxID=29920 RepID=A0A8T1UC83_9STRA|nr:hypothetical protein JG687_00010335 [Phytophthora cactorum]
MQRSNLAEDYDLEGVTARLEAMKARRGKWQNRKNEGPEKQQLSERETTCGFELAPADLSSGGSDVDSDDGYQSSSTNSLPSDEDKAMSTWSHKSKSRGKTRKLRVADSLDLSMSVAMSSGSSRQAETMHSGCTSSRATYFMLPGRNSTWRRVQQNDNSQASSSAHPEYNTICKPSRIPKLVQQRRQLHADRQCTVPSGGHLQAPMSVKSSNAPTNKRQNKTPPSGDCLKGLPPSKIETQPHSTKSPVRDVSKLNNSTSARKESFGGVSDEIASTTAEEQRLLQSLEKLDRRLSNVSNSAVSVREGGQQVSHKERNLKIDYARARKNMETPSRVFATKEKIDDDTLRAAAYGGGTHCKIRQPSSVSVRSSSAKRAELSSGFHKARVRVGGAFVNDAGRNSHTDGSGKHKIMMKKDLAHLLF